MVERIRTALERARATYQGARQRVEQLGHPRNVLDERRRAELDVARLEGMLEEHRTTILELGGPDELAVELRVLRAADKEADERARAAAGELFMELDREVLRLARDFGIEALEEVRLNRAGQLALRKGGESTSFSHVTQGERLRLKIAVVIALFRIGHLHGVGRHPGLLIVDSPGAEEAGAEDVTRVLRELVAVAEELPKLQILTATARADLVVDVLSAERLRIAEPGGTLW